MNLYKNCSECEQIYLRKRILKSFNVKEYGICELCTFTKYIYLLHRHECFTGKYTTRKIHNNYIRDPSGLFSLISHVSLSMTYFRSFPSIILSMSFCLYNKKNITRRLEDMNFIFEWQKQYFTHSLRSFVKYSRK